MLLINTTAPYVGSKFSHTVTHQHASRLVCNQHARDKFAESTKSEAKTKRGEPGGGRLASSVVGVGAGALRVGLGEILGDGGWAVAIRFK